MKFIQKKRYIKYKGVSVKGFSHPSLRLHGTIPIGKIVGYGNRYLIVSCDNVKGWTKDKMKQFYWIDDNEVLDNENGYWFVDLNEIKNSLD